MTGTAIFAVWLSGLISLWLSVRAFRHRAEIPTAGWLSVLMGSIALWSFAYAVELNLKTLDAMRWTTTIAYIGMGIVPVSWFGFALAQSGKGHLLTRRRFLLLLAFPFFITVMVASNPSHLLFYREVLLGRHGGYQFQILIPGALWWPNTLYSYVWMISGIVLTARLWLRVRGNDRKRITMILLGVLVPYLLNFGYVFGLRPGGYLDLTPVGFTVMGLLFFYGVFSVGLFDVFPQALDTLFDRQPDALFVLDAHRKVVSQNPVAQKLLAQPAFRGRFLETLSDGSGQFGPLTPASERQLDISIGEAMYEQRVVPLGTKLNQITGYLVILHDITRREADAVALRLAKEDADAANRAKSEFLANMSHEIRTPLNGVIGLSELMSDGNLSDAECREYARIIHQSGMHLLELISDILDISKIEAGKLELERREFHLSAMIQELVQLMTPKAREKGLRLKFALSPELPGVLHGDSHRIRQILLNLIGNAIKFTEQGGVDVRISRVEKESGKFRIRYEVEDTGIGIPPESRGRLFQKFSQVDGSITRRYGGSGLGLALCRELAGAMGAEIDFESEAGHGSRFWLEIPL